MPIYFLLALGVLSICIVYDHSVAPSATSPVFIVTFSIHTIGVKCFGFGSNSKEIIIKNGINNSLNNNKE